MASAAQKDWAPGMRFFVGLILGLSLLAGCGTPSSPAQATAAGIRRDLERLEGLDVGTPTADSLAAREGLRSFLDTLAQYQRHVKEVERDGETLDASDLREALARAERIYSRLEETARQLTIVSEASENGYNELRASASPEQANQLESSLEHLQVTRRAAAMAPSTDDQLLTLHRQLLTSGTAASPHGPGVFHFLRLDALGDPQLESHSAEFERVWKDWIRSEKEADHFGEALAIALFVVESTGAFPPDGLESIREVVDASLEKVSELHIVEDMEASLRATRSAIQALANPPADWEAELGGITAALMMVRARATEDHATRVSLAVEARRLDPGLEEKALAIVDAAEKALGDRFLESGRYTAAIEAFGGMLDRASVPDRERLKSNYRSTVFERGMDDAKKATRRNRFLSAKRILGQMTRVAATPRERTDTRSTLHSLYIIQVPYTLKRDPEAAIRVCEEMVNTFPSDSVAKRKLDAVRYAALKRSFGDLDTCHKRLGSSKASQLFHDTEASMSTREGRKACRNLLGKIREAWTRALANAATAAEVAALASDLAELRGLAPADKRKSEVAALASFFVRAAAARQWDQIESCIELYQSEYPSEERPASYRDVYLNFLTHLDRKGNLERLGQHVASFSNIHPDDVDHVRELIVKHARSDTIHRAKFAALLKAIYPESEADPTTTTTVAEEDRTEPTDSRSGSLFHTVGCSFLVILVSFLTWRRGLLPFQWYLLAALWVGIAIGSTLPHSTVEHEQVTARTGQGTPPWQTSRVW